jgi:kynurenine formamidase
MCMMVNFGLVAQAAESELAAELLRSKVFRPRGTAKQAIERFETVEAIPSATNWGRWGKEDERGAANYITDSVTKSAAGLIRTGRIYNLSLPIQGRGVPRMSWRPEPKLVVSFHGMDLPDDETAGRYMKAADDHLAISVHTGTHIDALAHCWSANRIYNGFPAGTVTEAGAQHCGIDELKQMVGRGVLLDVRSFRKGAPLRAGEVISGDELAACANHQKTELREGDILLIRTGWLEDFREEQGDLCFDQEPGIGLDAAEWIRERRFAAVGADNFAVEAVPSETGLAGPVHLRLIRDSGCYLFELVVLKDLAADQVYEFFFVAAPLQICGALGSPVAPLAIS